MQEPTITIPELVDEDVKGSGEYTPQEVLSYLDRHSALIAERRAIVQRVANLYAEAVAAGEAATGEDPAVTAKIEEGYSLSFARLEKEFSAAYAKVPPPPQIVRDVTLKDLYEHFDSYDVDKSGGLSLAESKLSKEVYLKLSPTGELTPEKIKLGISLDERPKESKER
jgi:hypothetical protein